MFRKLSDLPRRVTVTRITPEDMRHPQLAPRPVACPQCGTPLEIDPQCRIEHLVAVPYQNRALPIPRREKVRPAALCPSCDFCTEIRR